MPTAALVAAVLSIGAVTAGCSDGALSDAGDAPAAPQPAIETRDWGVLDSLVSVVVVNTTDRTLRYGQGQVRALDADGHVVATSPDGRGACCSIVDLAPGQQYGLYLDAGADAAEVRDVEVDLRNLSWATADAATARATGTARDLAPTSRGAVVDAELRVPDDGERLLVQAFLEAADGSFLGVVSGRWDCLPAGPTPIRMQLFHPVPAGARVERLVTHSVTDEPSDPASACDSADRAR